ncbi:nucleotidyl transferase AbiEii/AbiGii toxin family protein [Fodinisporobacter ferrooxydans]|uniref:Nucleotidyl transferase AbiEii/AbiGii toxin family protein n=1 Tax=Fodinisporobacter ferrooxydans TaxID=2901836 RepID=A0ABY4CN11_9BACL|nr:nucleotidyl transferase AbiEii/AbiGii toxin family protein [Alicyclobacillaceae bacterium MYW30-H2]
MFWKVIDLTRQSVLRKILESPPVKNCYLAGGTALAFQLGHRESIDFNWFTPDPFTPEQIETGLSEQGRLMITEAKPNTFHGILDGVQVTWLRYTAPLLESPIVSDILPQLKIASILDIGTMKLIAASQQGARKDFIDLYVIEQSGLSLTSLIRRLPEKFPNTSINYYHIVKSLVYFDDAEQEPMPRMLKPLEWTTVKEFFVRTQKQLLNSIP